MASCSKFHQCSATPTASRPNRLKFKKEATHRRHSWKRRPSATSRRRGPASRGDTAPSERRNIEAEVRAVRAARIYNRTMLVKLVRNWRVAVDAFKRDAAIEARVAAKRAEVRGWLEGGNLGASLDGSLSESLKFLT